MDDLDKNCNILVVPGKVEDRFVTEQYKNEVVLYHGRGIDPISCLVPFHLGQIRFIAGSRND